MRFENIHQAKSKLSKLIEETLAGEEVIICKAGKPVVKLIPYQDFKEDRVPGLLRGKIMISNDFDVLPPEVLLQFQGDSE